MDVHTPIRVLTIDLFRALEGQTAYPFVLMLEQTETEAILRRRLHALGRDVEWGVEATGLTAGDGGAAVELTHAGRTESVDADWVVGADGAGSFVREASGVAFTGATYEQRYVVADVRAVEGGVDPTHVNVNLNRWGFVLLLPLPAKGVYRLVTTFPPGFDDAGREPTFADVQRATDAVFPGGLRVTDPSWFSIFRIASRRVAVFRRGRVCFVGDAAHVHSPVGARA